MTDTIETNEYWWEYEQSHEYYKHNKGERLKEALKLNEETDIHKFQTIFQYLYNINQKMTEGETLYALIFYHDKEKIIEIGKDDFKIEMFNTKGDTHVKWFYRTPIPLFVVDKANSEFADEEQQKERENKQKEYLSKYTVMVIPKWWEAYKREIYWHNPETKKINYHNINILPYEQAIIEWRNAILRTKITSEERFEKFIRFMEKLQKKDINALKYYLYRTIKDENEIMFIDHLRNMWINSSKEENKWNLTFVEHAKNIQENNKTTETNVHIEALLKLINSFDAQKRKFTKLPD